jgi:hypothetical protein
LPDKEHVIQSEMPCCGAFFASSFAVKERGAELDVSADPPLGAGHWDVWVAKAPCDVLFDPGYDGPGTRVPRCTVVLGPVAPGTLSSRVAAPIAEYRAFVYGWSSNASPVIFGADVGIWAPDCSSALTRPTSARANTSGTVRSPRQRTG